MYEVLEAPTMAALEVLTITNALVEVEVIVPFVKVSVAPLGIVRVLFNVKPLLLFTSTFTLPVLKVVELLV
jgi:hypothetical protein